MMIYGCGERCLVGKSLEKRNQFLSFPHAQPDEEVKYLIFHDELVVHQLKPKGLESSMHRQKLFLGDFAPLIHRLHSSLNPCTARKIAGAVLLSNEIGQIKAILQFQAFHREFEIGE